MEEPLAPVLLTVHRSDLDAFALQQTLFRAGFATGLIETKHCRLVLSHGGLGEYGCVKVGA
jgi:hypothetical protein